MIFEYGLQVLLMGFGRVNLYNMFLKLIGLKVIVLENNVSSVESKSFGEYFFWIDKSRAHK
jgi:hypothetical protein